MSDLVRLRADLDLLASNLRWAWHQPTRAVFEELDPVGWRRCGRNPVAMLAEVPAHRWRAAAEHPDYGARVAAAVAGLEQELADATPSAPAVAYYSAEFALADAIATYSGGLGVLAGDHLRSASDLRVPLVAVGLAYRDGYFRQTFDASGWQQAHPATNDFTMAPVSPVLDEQGRRRTVDVEVGDGTVRVQAWRADVGRVALYLLDTDVDPNQAHHRAITGQLYGGTDETRIRQELILGIGGARFLDELGLDVEVHHLNEGHAAFAGLERLRHHLDAGRGFDDAVRAVRDELVFTTHTPVPAGHDRFDHHLVAYHLEPFAARAGVDIDQLWTLATAGVDDRWNQTILALSLAGKANGVARLHGEVSRRMWAHLWPDRTVEQVPIGHVTNGVHPGLWVGPHMSDLYDWELGPAWRQTTDPDIFARIRATAPLALWRAHTAARHRLIEEVRARLAAYTRRVGLGPDGRGLDPDALTIGFARRFATYKRATLMLHDIERLAAILGNDERPVQLIVAGKAHPADDGGKHLIQDLVACSRDPRLRGRLVVVEGYDLELAQYLVAGVDVWLNNPLRPMEASGTSGMKAAMNGVLNLSVLDGWWDEAVADLAPRARAGFGWAIGDRREDGDQPERDARDADVLYRLLTDEVVPRFHDRDADGVPRGWVTMMQDAIALLMPRFSTHRMVADYVEQTYGIRAASPR